MKNNLLAKMISGYKISISTVRIIIGILIIYFSYNLLNLVHYISDRGVFYKHHSIFLYLFSHMKENTMLITSILAASLIVISLAEIIFATALFLRQKWGANGLLVTCILWVPIEILFISKFLLFSKSITLLADLLIILFLIRLVIKKKNYFKKD